MIFTICSCGGPEIETCTSSPKDANFHCYSYATDTKSLKLLSEIDGWGCLSPYDMHSLLDACKRHIKGPAVNQCIISAEDAEMICFDERTQTGNIIKFADTENYICVSPGDEKHLLDYCKTIKL